MTELTLTDEFLVVIEDDDDLTLDDRVEAILKERGASYELDELEGVACYTHVEVSNEALEQLKSIHGLGIYKVSYERLERN